MLATTFTNYYEGLIPNSTDQAINPFIYLLFFNPHLRTFLKLILARKEVGGRGDRESEKQRKYSSDWLPLVHVPTQRSNSQPFGVWDHIPTS